MKPYLFDILIELRKNNVDFILCGGVACVLQGCERSTFDLDINIALSTDNLEKAIQVLKKMKYSPRIPEPFESLLDSQKRKKWVEEKGALVFTAVSSVGLVQVDVFLDYPIEYSELKNNADTFELEDHKFLVSSKSDLIKAKQIVKPVREKDIFDIKVLERLIREEENDKKK